MKNCTGCTHTLYVFTGPYTGSSVVYVLQVSQAASYLSLGTYAFAYTMEGFMSSTLSLNASHIAITDLVVEPGSVISQASQTVKLRVDLTATPSGASTATMVRHETFRILSLH